MKLFLQKMQNFQALRAPPPDPRASGGWELSPQTSSGSPIGLRGLGAQPPVANFWLRACIDVYELFTFTKVRLSFVENHIG